MHLDDQNYKEVDTEAPIFLQPHKREEPGMWFSWVFRDMNQFIYESEVKFIHSNFKSKLKGETCDIFIVINHNMAMICHRRLRKHAKLKYWFL